MTIPLVTMPLLDFVMIHWIYWNQWNSFREMVDWLLLVRVMYNRVNMIITFSWSRIPRKWGADPPARLQHTILPNIPQKNCMKLRNFWAMGGAVLGVPLLGSANDKGFAFQMISSFAMLKDIFFYSIGGSRISPRWGCQLSRGRQYTILPNFPKNCMKLK